MTGRALLACGGILGALLAGAPDASGQAAVTIKHIPKEKLRLLPAPLPPSEEQLRIVEEVERQFSFIEACERAVDEGLARSAALRWSVLRAAFEGRLVPQDPSDEPASVLLERIRAERATSAATGSPAGARPARVRTPAPARSRAPAIHRSSSD